MTSSRYLRWLSAEKKAQEAEAELRTAARDRKSWNSPPGPAGRKAQQLRLEADSLFDEAMDEMNRDVDAALAQPVRQPR